MSAQVAGLDRTDPSNPVERPMSVDPSGALKVALALNPDGSLRRPPVLVMTSGLSPVVAGGSTPGWVSGDISNLAVSAQAYVVFDLGPNWDQYVMLSVVMYPVIPSSGLSGVQVIGSDTTAYSGARRKNASSATTFSGIYASVTSAAGASDLNFRPSGRYVIVVATNADAANVQGAGAKITLTAYPS